MPEILAKLSSGEELKMWIAGCATGEEVFSMAILIAEQLIGPLEDITVKLFATDIDSAALEKAGKGIYNKTIKKDVSAKRLEKYFILQNDQYRINPFIRKMVIFAHHDLVKNSPYFNMHLISCRNLLIYMTPVLQKKMFNIFLFGLKMNGYLFLGSSENPMSIIKYMEVVNKKWKIYKNIEIKKGATFDTFSLPALMDTKRIPSGFIRDEPARTPGNTLTETIHTKLAEELGYLMVCVDEHDKVVKSYGITSPYLLNKHFSVNLTELLPKPLAVAFNTLSRVARKTNQKGTINGVKIKQGKVISTINLSVKPLIENGMQKLLMVIFTPEKSPVSLPGEEPLVYDETIYHDKYLRDLEEELQEAKDKLYSAYEKLDAFNENLQSFNEELISANEEMQSTNEEMQSVNEELNTINAEYQKKNKKLLELNDDLNNYFKSNINGQLFINSELQLMKFSPGTVKQINLLNTDIGRPLSNISTNFKFETIIDDIKQVIARGTVVTKEIQTNNGRWYQTMTMPYLQQSDQKRKGAIITFNDITELKKIQQELNASVQMLGMAIASAEMGTWTIDIKTLEFIPSVRLKEIFGFYPEEDMSYEAAVTQIINEHQLKVIDAVKASIENVEKFDVEYCLRGFHDGKLRWVKAMGSLTEIQEGKPTYFTGILIDITAHKQDELRKNDFIAMVSHELKTPLTSLQVYVQLLAKKAKDAPAVEMLSKANKQVKKMTALINGFLNISQLETGKIYLNLKVFIINELITEIVEEFDLISVMHTIVIHDCPPYLLMPTVIR